MNFIKKGVIDGGVLESAEVGWFLAARSSYQI
jgi:hypothetical protein